MSQEKRKTAMCMREWSHVDLAVYRASGKLVAPLVVAAGWPKDSTVVVSSYYQRQQQQQQLLMTAATAPNNP